MGGQQPRRLVAIVDAQALAGLVQMGVDRVLGDAEPAADLLGAQMVLDQAQALALARGQQLDGLAGRLLGLAHNARLTI
jgi:hypothetical protein